MENKKYKPTVLVILDGWGVAPVSEGNAITQSNLPNYDYFLKNYPAATLHASGQEVGLVPGKMGNSEVGHLNIGTGRIYYQTLPLIDKQIETGEFFENKNLIEATEHAKKNNSKIHLVGLLGGGNIHASSKHLDAILDFLVMNKIKNKVLVHGFLDGRDTPRDSGLKIVKELKKKIKDIKIGRITSLCGRFYAMDRDHNWGRTKEAYNLITLGKAKRQSDDEVEVIKGSYAQENYDEEFLPTLITKKGETDKVEDNDVVIFFNFRSDRMRQIIKSFVLPGFNKFDTKKYKNLYVATMTEYEKDLPKVALFTSDVLNNGLSQVISKNGFKQLHVAESQKYPHVTYFFNGLKENPFEGEDRLLEPSSKVSDYSKLPQMSAFEITKKVIKSIDKDQYDFIVINYANADMVGYTGNLRATIEACEVIDKCLGNLYDYVMAKNGAMVITADHGNAESVLNLQTNSIDKEHTLNSVPFIVINKDVEGQAGPSGDPPEGDLSLLPPAGVLADVAPTILELMGLEQPPEMTGKSLL